MGTFIDLAGQTFGNWEVLSRASPTVESHSTAWNCRCTLCGRQRVRLRTNLTIGKNVGCGCLHWAEKRPYEALFNELQRNAKKDNRIVTLTYEHFLDFVKQGKCPYCSADIHWTRKHLFKNGNNYNLDRKDNRRGYEIDNCVVCCARCNRAKSNHFSYEEWKQLGDLIRSWKMDK